MHLSQALEKAKQTAQKPQLAERPKAVVLHQDQAAKQQLAVILYQCFQSLKLYGKEPEALEATVATFNLVLADYEFSRIKDAFAFYLRSNTEMPAPADIANIIERGNKPPFDKAVYVSISKKSGEERTREEWQYMREYERFMVTGKN